jgi:hypothetical protein
VAPAAFLYFGAAAAITGLCILCFSMMTRLKYSRAKLGPYLASEFADRFVVGCIAVGCIAVGCIAVHCSQALHSRRQQALCAMQSVSCSQQ